MLKQEFHAPVGQVAAGDIHNHGPVIYVLAKQKPSSMTVLAPDEAALLEAYRATPADKRRTIREVSAALARP